MADCSGQVDTAAAARIGLCVPCTHGHFNVVFQYLFRTICAQTVAPHCVVVSVSELPNRAKLDAFDTSGCPCPIEFLCEPKKLLAGANRNRAAARAVELGATVLSFIDADDLMHPRRVEVVRDMFVKHPTCVGLIHSFCPGRKADKELYSGAKEPAWGDITDEFLTNAYAPGEYRNFGIIKYQGARKKVRGYGDGANGHISVRADYWKENPYSEVQHFGEDSHFSCSILRKKLMLGYTPNILSVYMR